MESKYETQASELIVSKNMQEIQEILNEGEKMVALSPGKDLVLLLGITGSGKSTLAQFLFGDPDELMSLEIEEGSGEYVIVDKGNKISHNSTILSKTVFPELVIDPKTESAYYDCPGFSDTRSAAHEISATYFIKRVVDSARSLKMVFVVNYHSVRKGVDRKDFILLLNHAVTFIKDVEKYKESIALVITKVENTYRNNGEMLTVVSDTNVIKSIAQFIKGVKNDLIENPNVIANGQTAAIQLLGALLHKVNEDYTKIGLFRRPNKEGVLNKIKQFQSGVKNLERIIRENILYKDVEKADFGYTISSDSKIYAIQLIDEIHNVIVKKLVMLGEEIKAFFLHQEGHASQLEIIIEKFNHLNKTFSDFQKKASDDALSAKEYLSNARIIIGSLNNPEFNVKMSGITNLEEFIDFLYAIQNESLPRHTSSFLVKGFTIVARYFNESMEWYSFLTDLYSRLSQYDVQKDKTKHFVNDQTDLVQEGSITFAQMRFSDELQQIIEETKKVFNGVGDIIIDSPKMSMFNRVINSALNSKVESIRDPEKLVVKGRFVILSEVFKDLKIGSVKQVEVFALERVFIDTSLDLTGREVQLAIVAPVLEVIGAQRIKLDGKPGDKHEPPKAEPGHKARPGLPGGPAGSFFGVFERVINEDSLSITAVGGKGGDGQDGTDGADGADAQPQWRGTYKSFLPLIVYNRTEYAIEGNSGRNGGDGGVGGYGGQGGGITIIHARQGAVQKSQFQHDAHDGACGRDGEGGKGGLGGLDGDYVVDNYFLLFYSRNITFPGVRRNRGEDGKPGINRQDIRGSCQVKKRLDHKLVVDSYYIYVQSELEGDMKETHLRAFLNTIHTIKDNNV